MNWFDVALAAGVLISIAFGIGQGFSRSGFGFVAVVVSFLTAAWFYPANLKGFVILFVGLLAGAAICGCLLGRSLKAAGTRGVDRLLGGVFGLVNVLLMSVLLVLCLMAFAPPSARKYVAHSKAAPYVANAACTVAQVLPDEMRYRVEDTYTELLQVLPPKFRRTFQGVPRTAGL